MSQVYRAKVASATSNIVNNKRFDIAISCVIVFNSLILGMQTMSLDAETSSLLDVIDGICLVIYVLEIAMRFISNPKGYFKSAWNIFDLTVVVLSIVPMLLPFPPQIARIIRIFRTLRVLLLVSALDPLRRIITSLLRSLPSIFWTIFLLAIVCYVYGITGFHLYGQTFPEYFGDLWATLFTLFQLTTLENWAEIAREVMAVEPASALYFVSFVLIAAFIIVNVVVGVIVSSMEETAKKKDIDVG